jgi:hypothetical protein
MYRTDSSSDASGSDPQDPRRRRLWMVLAAAAGVLFIVAVVPSARQDATPVGGSGSMGGMSMPAGAVLDLSVRDVDGRLLRAVASGVSRLSAEGRSPLDAGLV